MHDPETAYEDARRQILDLENDLHAAQANVAALAGTVAELAWQVAQVATPAARTGLQTYREAPPAIMRAHQEAMDCYDRARRSCGGRSPV